MFKYIAINQKNRIFAPLPLQFTGNILWTSKRFRFSLCTEIAKFQIVQQKKVEMLAINRGLSYLLCKVLANLRADKQSSRFSYEEDRNRNELSHWPNDTT